MVTEQSPEKLQEISHPDPNIPPLDFYRSQAYYDIEFVLKAITERNENTFLFFGDMQRHLYYISDNLRDTFGFSSCLVEDFFTQWIGCIPSKKWKSRFQRSRQQLLQEKLTTHDLWYQVQDKHGKVFWVRSYGSMKWDQNHEKPLFFSGRITRQDQEFIIDPLTGFPGESTLQLHLRNAIQDHREFYAVGFSLNNLTQINAVYGRKIGDGLIQKISTDLVCSLSSKATFYRLSGIRCAALISPQTGESPESVTDRIRQIIHADYQEMGCAVSTPCTFALMDFPGHEPDPAEFIDRLDTLIRLAAAQPQYDMLRCSPSRSDTARKVSDLQLVMSRDVLKNMQNFRVVIQPILSAHTGQVEGGEVFLRWRYQNQEIKPDVLLSVLGEDDQLMQIAAPWFIRQSITACSQLQRQMPEFYCSFNLFSHQFCAQFLKSVPEILSECGFRGDHLIITVTESRIDQDPDQIQELFLLCKQLKIRVALEQFGSGYSSLKALMAYDTHAIKLDRSLLAEMQKSDQKSNFITSIVFACHQFGKKVCAVGIETPEQQALMLRSGCDSLQGSFFPPAEPEVLLQRIEYFRRHLP